MKFQTKMKRKHHPIFTAALNVARAALNAASGVYQEINLPEGTTAITYRLSPYGEFPVDDVHGKPIIQVIDREVASTLAANFGSLATKFATFFRGIPIYEGHADDPDWCKKNPGHRASAVGRIKSIDPGEDGIYVTAALNSDGVELLGGDAPKYTGQSPFWRLSEIPGRKGYFKPVLLWSDALTNTPNIMTNTLALNSLDGIGDEDIETSPSADTGDNTENTEDTMKLTAEALAALGFAPDAEPSPDEISAAIVKMLGDKATAEADKATAEATTAAANSRAGHLETELNLVRGAAVETVVTDAINTGRITEAERPAWTEALNTSFASESAKLAKLMPAMNTTNKVIDLASRRQAGVTDAANAASRITEAVRQWATEKGIDITTAAGWTRAYDACRASSPALFAQ
jgi:hypothetical protein